MELTNAASPDPSLSSPARRPKRRVRFVAGAILTLGGVATLLAACAADDPRPAGGPLVATAATPEASGETTAAPATTSGTESVPTTVSSASATTTAAAAPPEIPDDAVDLTGRDTVTIVASDNRFTDRVVVVSPGTRIVWVNEGRNDHNVYPAVDEAFPPIPTDELEPGEQASLTFDSPGDFPYYCTIHGTPRRGMVGRIIVAG